MVQVFSTFIAFVIIGGSVIGCQEDAVVSQRSANPKQTQKLNRLARESSPYLLQHAHNPVDWYPWGDEAFEAATASGKPILLSVGYAACHWCHVMEHESFENVQIAELMNRTFICIKVDREERPDIDDQFMNFVQATTGRGGWPMTVLLTSNGKPFFGGTYFPPAQFTDLCSKVENLWKTRRTDIVKQAESLDDQVRRASRLRAGNSKLPSNTVVRDLLADLTREFDPKNGGFGKAPKFPPHNALPLLMDPRIAKAHPNAMRMATVTLDKIADGGIHDHVGGGFHRYSTDSIWLTPHFEKMLYDNALLARAYAEAYAGTGRPEYASLARSTLRWALTEMRGPEGGFYSSLDADSDGKEGAFYVWTKKQVIEVLGNVAGRSFCEKYGVTDAGNFIEQPDGRLTGWCIVHLADGNLVDSARNRDHLKLLLDSRNRRIRPNLDDKRLTAWNALMIGSLARIGQILGDKSLIDEARKTADFVMSKLAVKGQLLRRFRPQTDSTQNLPTTIPGFLDDYSYFADALLDLYAADRNAKWLNGATYYADAMIELFAADDGGFYDSPAGYDKLITRGKNGYDSALPSANAVAARVLFRLGALTGRTEFTRRAENTVRAFASNMEQSPRGTETMIGVFSKFMRNASAGENEDSATAIRGPVRLELSRVAGKEYANITITIRKGWHMAAHDADPKTSVGLDVQTISPVTKMVPKYPASIHKKLTFGGAPSAVYEGTIVVRVPIMSVSAKSLTVRVKFQSCNDKVCSKPETLTLVSK